MNPLPLVLSVALMTGCTVIETKDGAVTCRTQECINSANERTEWMQEVRRKTAKAEAWEAGEKAKEKAEEDRVRKENQAWNDAHPEEHARAVKAMIEYGNNLSRIYYYYDCPPPHFVCGYYRHW